MPYLGHIREMVDTLKSEVRSLTESYIIANPQVIPLVFFISPPCGIKYFNFFEEDNGKVPVVRTNRGHVGDR